MIDSKRTLGEELPPAPVNVCSNSISNRDWPFLGSYIDGLVANGV